MEKFISDLKNTVNTAVKKSGELVELTKLKVAIADTKNAIRNRFESLGELAYLAAKGEDTPASDAESLVADISELKATLSEQEAKAAELTNKKICSQCGKMAADDAAFCPSCGNPLQKEEA